MAATVVFEASVVRINGRLKSGNASTGALHNLPFRPSKAFCCSGPQMNGRSLFVSCVSEIVLKFSIE